MVDETALQNYLLKCELQYRADHADGVERVGWLMEYTRTAEQTARFLRDIGFRVKEVVDDMDCAGEHHCWVVTKNAIEYRTPPQGGRRRPEGHRLRFVALL